MNKDLYSPVEIVGSITRYDTVMLIDDNHLDNYFNKSLMEKDRFAKQIVIHEGGKSALDFLCKATEEDLPDLILLDINMPEMDGFEFLDQFRNLPDPIIKKCRIIMLSTSESFKDLNRANKNRFVCKFLNKPLTEQILLAINI